MLTIARVPAGAGRAVAGPAAGPRRPALVAIVDAMVNPTEVESDD